MHLKYNALKRVSVRNFQCFCITKKGNPENVTCIISAYFFGKYYPSCSMTSFLVIFGWRIKDPRIETVLRVVAAGD